MAEIFVVIYGAIVALFAAVLAFVIVVVAIVGATIIAFSPFIVVGAILWGLYRLFHKPPKE